MVPQALPQDHDRRCQVCPEQSLSGFTLWILTEQRGTTTADGAFRTIGINRTSQTAILQLRPNQPQETTGIQWLSYGSMPYNTAVPFFTQVSTTPDYFANTTDKVSTDSFYWANRLIAGLADAHFSSHVGDLDDYQEKTMAWGHEMIGR